MDLNNYLILQNIDKSQYTLLVNLYYAKCCVFTPYMGTCTEDSIHAAVSHW